MAAAVMNKNNKQAKVRGRLPVKKTINMATVGEKKTRFTTVFLTFILILLLVAAFAKFLVMDRLALVDQEEQKVRDLRTQLSAANAKLDSFGELKEKYAHYTFADMTGEELRRVERSDVVDLIERIVMPNATLNNWNVRQNQLTLNVTLNTLQDTNLLAQLLNEDAMVEFATVKNAVTTEIKQEDLPEVPETEAPAEEAGAGEETPAAEEPGENAGEGEAQEKPAEENTEGMEETVEPLYNVTAQIIVYLTIAEKEG